MTCTTVLKSLVFSAVMVALVRTVEVPDCAIVAVAIFAWAGLVFWRNHLRRVAVAILAAALVSAFIQGLIYRRVERTEAEVIHLSAKSSWSRGPRTTFAARVRYTVGRTFVRSLDSGRTAQSRGRPVEQAAYRRGDKVTILYDPRNPAVQFEDSGASVFIRPILIAILAVGAWA